MMHPDIQQFLAGQRIDDLRNATRHPYRTPVAAPREDESRIELRLCRVGDTEALERLAALEGRALPEGRFVLAEVDGRLVAALAVACGAFLADPFARTAHLRKLLELRAAQLEEPKRRGLLGWRAAICRT
jgi:hypothetical protein